jgi:hypothetical protein
VNSRELAKNESPSAHAGLEKVLENERQPSVGEEETSWLNRIAEIDLKHGRLLDLHLDGDITTERFRVKSAELEGARAAAERQLEVARSRLAHLKDIELSKDALTSPTPRPSCRRCWVSYPRKRRTRSTD